MYEMTLMPVHTIHISLLHAATRCWQTGWTWCSLSRGERPRLHNKHTQVFSFNVTCITLSNFHNELQPCHRMQLRIHLCTLLCKPGELGTKIMSCTSLFYLLLCDVCKVSFQLHKKFESSSLLKHYANLCLTDSLTDTATSILCPPPFKLCFWG